MKKYKFKKKIKYVILLIPIITITLIAYNYIMKDKNENNLLYKDEAIKVFKEHDDISVLQEYKYSKTLEKILLNDSYNSKYLNEYINIDYIDTTDFLININSYLSKGYNANEINNIFTLSELNQEKLLSSDYINFTNYTEIENFNVENVNRYEEYKKNNENLDLSSVVTFVNLQLDQDFYTNINQIKDPSRLDVLVNKYNNLGNYEPENLIPLERFSNYKLREDAALAFNDLIDYSIKKGLSLSPFSTYRSYEYQKGLYNYYMTIDPVEVVNTYSAKYGHSEHQTGLAVDIMNAAYQNKTNVYLSDEDYEWILENSYKYGFIVRYPKESINITGYMEEPWHLRFLGIELATKVVESKLTYDEYYDLYIKEY